VNAGCGVVVVVVVVVVPNARALKISDTNLRKN
jgi:hypothetical protein